jgi:hypothetical protein
MSNFRFKPSNRMTGVWRGRRTVRFYQVDLYVFCGIQCVARNQSRVALIIVQAAIHAKPHVIY